MRNEKHSTGPWKAMAGPPEYARIDSADERDIARCPRKEDTTRAEANAYLIAAAPEMLKALAEADLRCTQARLASTIGKKAGQADFLRGELERIQTVLTVAIQKTQGV